MANQKYIFRGDRSGVFYGEMGERKDREVQIINCRRLWYWDGAASLSQLALEGVTEPQRCKFTVTVPELTITDLIEFIPCSDAACSSIDGVAAWKR